MADAVVVLATRNPHKVDEIRDAFHVPGVTFTSMDEFPHVPETVEDGDTFEANARKKAREVCAATGLAALADDSGLVVDALGGEPGVRSARFAGEDADDAANRALLVQRIRDVPEEQRTARFVCVLALALPGDLEMVVAGECSGRILTEERGDGGFGYDPLFVADSTQRTFAEMSRREKAALSHRGRALVNAQDAMGRLLREWAGRLA
ncbi:MAG: non-canonical purine NTP pyrophosphatase [Gemmatimonadota bacterium]|nr:MAG: non-canonical purine NTP pyrophosphatase [Gemmatimonadota bacterium]